MRIPSSVFAVGRYGLAVLAVAGSVVFLNAEKKTAFTIHDKAYYADSNTVNFVRPGLTITIVSAKIATDGTISVNYKLADPKGLALDPTGVSTPGAISVSFVAAYIPKGQTQFFSYTTRTQTSPITKVTAIQAGADSGGTTQTLANGDYVYTFKAKALSAGGGAFDPTATHRIGLYGNRNLSEFDLGTNYDSDTYDFVPGGGAPAPRDVIRTASCNKCHDQLAFHGGSRRGIEMCVMCHTPQTSDPDTGNTVDFKVMVHKIHRGSGLPSVKAGTPYQIIGFSPTPSDWSTVVLPSDARRCQFCHEPKTGAAQADAWIKNPNRAACGSCHDDVNFATGQNHVNLPQVNDNQCTQCHIPKGELEFDASIMGAHVVPVESSYAQGINLEILKVDGAAGKAPAVTFTVRDDKGNGIPSTVAGFRLALVMAGPTSDYGYTNFGADVTTKGYVSENPVATMKCSPDGNCTYTFTHAIPAKATGTFAIGIEGRRTISILPGTTLAQTANEGAINKVAYFSVDGSKVEPRRKVVDIAKCNGCHSALSLHGGNRNQIEQCVLCHNPSMDDSPTRPLTTNAAEKAKPNQAINFSLMVHKIHTGEKMTTEFGTQYTIIGNGGSVNDFTEVRFPTMTPTGGVGDTAKCYMCHVNNSETVFPVGKNDVVDPQGRLNPAPATTAACTACHQSLSALSHAVAQSDPKYGESCDVCHAIGRDFDVLKEHAGH